MKVYVVRETGGINLAVFSTRERAEFERRYLAALDPEESDPYVPLANSEIEEHELDLSFEDV